MKPSRPRGMGAGSAYKRSLPQGCQLCRSGSKMVLLVTGECGTGCFYCPLSAEKRGRKVTFADELRVGSDQDVLLEARSIRARGTGITGGDPLAALDETVRYIQLLRSALGPRHHIHLYTATIDRGAYLKLQEAGLDELRVHPSPGLWRRMHESGLEQAVRGLEMKVGLEVPALPGEEGALEQLVRYADSIGLDFVNLNELEFSETNFEALRRRGIRVKDDASAAARGSEETALRMLDLDVRIPLHYCSSSFKDSVQLRRRLLRRARTVARKGDVITAEGTLVKGVVEGEGAEAARALLRDEYRVPDSLMHLDLERGRLEVAPWVLRELEGQLPFDSHIVEEYPTADRLEVERERIKGKSARRRGGPPRPR